jgi:hypothetical protein
MAMAQMTAGRSRAASDYSASSVPILQLALSGEGLSEQQLFDFAVQLHPHATGDRSRRGHALSLRRKAAAGDDRSEARAAAIQGLSPTDVVNAFNTQNLILPAPARRRSGSSSTTWISTPAPSGPGMNDLPVKAGRQHTPFTCATWRTCATASRRRPTSCGATAARRAADSILKNRQRLDARHREAGADMLPARSAATLPPELKIEPMPINRSSCAPR